MIKSKRLLVLAIFSVFCFVVGQAMAAEAPKSVKVGLMFGLTGAASVIGPVQLDGAKLAIQEINAGIQADPAGARAMIAKAVGISAADLGDGFQAGD